MSSRVVLYSIYAILAILLVAAYLRLHVVNMATPSDSSNAGTPPSVEATSTSEGRTIQLGGQTVHVDVADTPALREKGLGGRAGLAEGQGMLFVFQQDGLYAFWMKDMSFAIDIIWLNSDGKIVYRAQSVSPDTYPQAFRPDSPSRYVVELPAGFAKEYNLHIGDQVQL